jgi:Tol biopolymer transport system component
MDRPAGMRGIFVADIDGTHAKRIHPENAYRPRWSPDGRTVLAVRTDWSGIYLIPTRGGPTKLIKKSASSASWSPDGTKIAYTSPPNGLHVLDLRTGQDRTITLRPNVCKTGSCDDVDWARTPTR